MTRCVHLAELSLFQVTSISGKKKVHIWSSLLDFAQIINAVIVHLEQKQTFSFKTEFGKYFHIIKVSSKQAI